MNEGEILLNYLKDESWRYFHEDGEPYKTISMQERDILIKYITQLQNNWNELKKGLQSLFEFDEGVVSKDYLECAEDILDKMQELRGDDKN